MYGRTSSAAFADLDGDADLDLVIGRNYRDTLRGNLPTVVLKNDGGHLSAATTLVTDLGARSIGVLDYDGDGRLDLFVTEDHWSGGTSILFHNDGALQFSNATAAAGLPVDIRGLGVATSDLNADGRPDLLVSGSVPPQGQAQIRVARVFVNNGNATFRETDGSVFSGTRSCRRCCCATKACRAIGSTSTSTARATESAPWSRCTAAVSSVRPARSSPGARPRPPRGSAQASQRIAVTLIGDALAEGDETFSLTLSNPSGVLLGDSQGTGTILDEEGQPVVSVGDAWVVEGQSGTKQMAFPVTLSRPAASSTSVHVSSVNVTAKTPKDYIEFSTTLTFAPGETQKTLVATVKGDITVEPNETFLAKLTSPSGVVLGDVQATGTIVTDDPSSGPTPLPSVYVSDAVVVEGNSGTSAAAFTVSLSRPAPAGGVSVNYATANGTAKAAGDFTAVSATLRFAQGEISKTVVVAVKGDTVAEPNETFSVNLSNPVGLVMGDKKATGTIVDEEGQPVLSVSENSVVEGHAGTTSVTITVSLSRAASSAVSVSYATANGTALAPGDYTALAPTTLTFAPGETTKTVVVTIVGDTAIEPNETVLLDLTMPVGVVVGDNQATGTIENDD